MCHFSASLKLRNWAFLPVPSSGFLSQGTEGLPGSSKSAHGRAGPESPVLETNVPAALSTASPSPCSQGFPVLRCFHICREGMRRTKLFPQDKECKRLLYFLLSTSMRRSSPPGTGSTELPSSPPQSAAQSSPGRADVKLQEDQSRGRRGSRAKAEPEAMDRSYTKVRP